MNYRSIADLSKTVASNMWKVPGDVDLIVGVPRSGMMVAFMIGLQLNLKVCDVNSLVENKSLHFGSRPTRNDQLVNPLDARHILVVDDSASAGTSITKVKERLARIANCPRISYLSAYSSKQGVPFFDINLEVVEHPRLFEWNIMHRAETNTFCFDIDGVLCIDPTNEENDDGPKYTEFLKNAAPLLRPSSEIGYLVTSRLERYRPETEAWLKRNGVLYKRLYMLDVPDAATRRKNGLHASFKANVFKSLSESRVFIESDPSQAIAIANFSGKHVIDYTSQIMIRPEGSINSVVEKVGYDVFPRIKRKLSRALGLRIA